MFKIANLLIRLSQLWGEREYYRLKAERLEYNRNWHRDRLAVVTEWLGFKRNDGYDKWDLQNALNNRINQEVKFAKGEKNDR